jgi:hypothetical protein
MWFSIGRLSAASERDKYKAKFAPASWSETSRCGDYVTLIPISSDSKTAMAMSNK